MHFAFGQIAEGKSCNTLREKGLQKTGESDAGGAVDAVEGR